MAKKLEDLTEEDLKTPIVVDEVFRDHVLKEVINVTHKALNDFARIVNQYTINAEDLENSNILEINLYVIPKEVYCDFDLDIFVKTSAVHDLAEQGLEFTSERRRWGHDQKPSVRYESVDYPELKTFITDLKCEIVGYKTVVKKQPIYDCKEV